MFRRLTAMIAAPVAAFGVSAAAASPTAPAGASPAALTVTPILNGNQITHTFTVAGQTKTAPLSKPDDLTAFSHDIFVAFQNGVGAQGEPASNGNTQSTVVEVTTTGQKIAQWDVAGKVDGLKADHAHNQLIATVNEDGNSSLYTIDPTNGAVTHYTFNQNPLPHNGGTDAISIYHGQILVSASAPGTASAANQNPAPAPDPSYAAVYRVNLDPATQKAGLQPLYSDEATATAANGPQSGQPVKLGLTDPDSNKVVPGSSPRFGGDFMLDSQGDQQQIYAQDAGGPQQTLSVLNLDQSVDDTAWAKSPNGTLFGTSPSTDEVDAITGEFAPGTAYVAATPCGANSAPSNCSASNFLGTLDLGNGHVAPVATPGAPFDAQGLLFLP